MSMNPRNWGRIPQLALVVLIALRSPTLLTFETPVGIFGGVLGLVFGGVVAIGLLRLLVVTIRGRGDKDVAATS